MIVAFVLALPAGLPGTPAQAQEGEDSGPVTLVTIANLHLRAAPSTAARIYSTAPQDTTLIASAISPNFRWLRVDYNGQGGWMARQYLELQSGDVETLPVSSEYVPPAVISATTYAGLNEVVAEVLLDVNLREDAVVVEDDIRTTFEETNVITVIPVGAEVSVRTISVDGLWVFVEYGPYRGWVRGRYLNVTGGVDGPVPYRPEVPVDGDGIGFVADSTDLLLGQCTNLRWSVVGDGSVYYKARTVTGQGTRRECPTQTTRYSLTVVRPGYQIQQRFVTVRIVQAQLDFTTTAEAVQLDQCATLSWSSVAMDRVYFNRELEPVASSGSREVCPRETTTYTLRGLTLTGEIVDRQITITVFTAPQPGTLVTVAFYPESAFLSPGQCTNLIWNATGAVETYFQGQPVAPSGSRQECPTATTTYILRVYTVDNRTLEYQAMITVN
ncbi:MAG: SH3 domain-containing protein [Anaerolineae bacterium]|nr:SH3 domain-containing protein [Anaerolineae bacterium]